MWYAIGETVFSFLEGQSLHKSIDEGFRVKIDIGDLNLFHFLNVIGNVHLISIAHTIHSENKRLIVVYKLYGHPQQGLTIAHHIESKSLGFFVATHHETQLTHINHIVFFSFSFNRDCWICDSECFSICCYRAKNQNRKQNRKHFLHNQTSKIYFCKIRALDLLYMWIISYLLKMSTQKLAISKISVFLICVSGKIQNLSTVSSRSLGLQSMEYVILDWRVKKPEQKCIWQI